MGQIKKAISKDGFVICYATDTTDIVHRAERIHRTSATVTAALGRLLTAASMMGAMLDDDDHTVTVRMKGDGPAGALIAVSNAQGDVRGYVENPIVEIPLNQHGKLDVAGAVGTQGSLSVVRDLGKGEPYVGQTTIVSGEVAEDITHYFATSEQVPTVCALGVLVNPDLTVKHAGGFLVQLLPGAGDDVIDKLEATLATLSSVTQMLEQGMTAEELALKILDGFDPVLIDRFETHYRCDCSRERVEKALLTLGKEELFAMAEEQPLTEVTCHFCPKIYRFTPDELRALV